MPPFVRLSLLFISIALAFACAAPPAPEPRPLGRDRPVRAEEPADPVAPTGAITLREALAAALAGNPELAAAGWAVESARGLARQAGLPPNPEVEVEMEEFGGEGPLAGTDSAEVSLSLSQRIPLAGRLGHAREAARRAGRLAGWDREAARLDVLAGTTKAFVDVLAAQDLTALAREGAAAAEEVARAVSEQVAAGKAPALEAEKASVARELLRLDREEAERDLEIARRRLAATWGGSGAAFERAQGELNELRPVPPAAKLEGLLAEAPEIARWEDERAMRLSRLEAARASGWPDVTLRGGVARFRETDRTAFLAGISLPLPIFDRNQGGIAAALAESRRAGERRRAAEVRSGLRAAWEDLAAAHAAAETLRERVVPVARTAFEASRAGFRQGKFDYLVVLDAQRTLFQARERLVRALARYHKDAAEVERRIGRPLEEAAKE